MALGSLALFPLFIGMYFGWLGFEIVRQVVVATMEIFL